MSNNPIPHTPTPASHGGPPSAAHAAGQSVAGNGPESLSVLEREVLQEYGELLENLNKLSPLLADLSVNPTAQVLDNLRVLERKASLVSTLLKASVYSIVLQQEMLESEGPPAPGSGARSDSDDGGNWGGSE